MTTLPDGSAPAGNPEGGSSGGSPPPDTGAGIQPDAGWTTGLQDADNRTVAQQKGWDKAKSPDVVITSYRDLEKRLGKSVVMPEATAPKEDHDTFWTKLGRPAKPDGYAFKLPEGIPENLPYDDAFATEYKNWSHEANLTPPQAQSIHDKFVKRFAGQMVAQDEAVKAKVGTAHREIQGKWGDEGTVGYNRNLQLMSRALRKLGLVDSYKASGLVTASGEITDAKVAFAMADIGKALYAEDNEHGGPGHATETNPWKEGQENLQEQGRLIRANKDQARALIIAAGKDPKKELWDPS